MPWEDKTYNKTEGGRARESYEVERDDQKRDDAHRSSMSTFLDPSGPILSGSIWVSDRQLASGVICGVEEEQRELSGLCKARGKRTT